MMDPDPHPDVSPSAQAEAAGAATVTADPDAGAGSDDPVVGTRIGRYKLLQRIGEGGWGVVYMAEQEEPVRRRLALKIIKLGMDTKSVIARFEAERQALAMMDHPNIARVLDAGATDAGRPFFVMELVRGISVTHYCDQHSLPMDERLRLFIQICQAVQHAHQKGVIHRDLKPSNILVSHQDGRAVPKVIDFGIAKASESRLTDKTLFTAFEQFIGTPAYMSPEQAEMSGLDIDTRSDIYSLGVLLYELLTGRTPFASGELAQAGVEGMRRILREHEPSRPSTRLQELPEPDMTSAARRRQIEPARLASLIRGDLDWIVMKAIDKDRTRRYATAHELAADVDRFLIGEPVTARPPSQLYRLRKMIRRHRLAVTGAAATVIALATGLAIAIWQYGEKKHAWELTVAAEAEKSKLLGEARAAQASEAKLRLDAEAQKRTARQRAYAADINLAQQALEANNLTRAHQLLAEYEPQAGDTEDLRGWEWHYLWHQCQGEASYALCQIDEGVRSLSISGDRRWVALDLGRGAEIAVWDLGARRETIRLNSKGETEQPTNPEASSPAGPGPDHPAVTGLRDPQSPDGSTATGSPANPEKPADPANTATTRGAPAAADLEVRSGRGGGVSRRRPFGPWERRVEFSPVGDLLAFASVVPAEAGVEIPAVRLWQASTGLPIKEIRLADRALQLVFSLDGQRLWVATEGGNIVVYDVATGGELATTPVGSGGRFAPLVRPSPDLETMVLAESNGPFAEGGSRLRLVTTGTGEQRWTVEISDPFLRTITYSRDGRWVAAGVGSGADSAIRVWETSNGQEVATLRGHRHQITSLVFLPDGHTLVSASEDRTIRVWDVEGERQEAILRGHRTAVRALSLMTDGSLLLSSGADGSVLVWDPGAMRLRRSHFELPVAVRSWVFAGDAASVITLSPSGRVSRWHGQHLEAEEVLFELTDGNRGAERLARPGPAAFSEDGGRLAVQDAAGSVSVWEIQTRRRIRRIPADQVKGRPSFVAFVPGSSDLLIETSGSEGRVERWDPLSGRLVNSWPVVSARGARPVSAVSDDGRWWVQMDPQGMTKWRNLQTGAETVENLGLSGVNQLMFSPDARQLIALSEREGGRLWEVEDRRLVAELGGFMQGNFSAAFSPDSRRLVLGSTGDEALKIWDLASQRELVTLEGQGGFHHSIRFSRDGQLLAASHGQGRLSFWRAPRPAAAESAPR